MIAIVLIRTLEGEDLAVVPIDISSADRIPGPGHTRVAEQLVARAALRRKRLGFEFSYDNTREDLPRQARDKRSET